MHRLSKNQHAVAFSFVTLHAESLQGRGFRRNLIIFLHFVAFADAEPHLCGVDTVWTLTTKKAGERSPAFMSCLYVHNTEAMEQGAVDAFESAVSTK